MAEWQRLTQHYGEMSDDELYELDADRADLTDVAQQVLSGVMKSRGLDKQLATKAEPATPAPVADREWELESSQPTKEDQSEERDLPCEYTWKVLLCECDERQEAWQLREALKAEGIESWVEGTRLLVAADQLDQAQEIAARPIPQAIVEEFREEAPMFEPPVCPSCGAADPTLLSANPLNSWECESCGKQWTDAAEEPVERS
jgi:hypothetical protein